MKARTELQVELKARLKNDNFCLKVFDSIKETKFNSEDIQEMISNLKEKNIRKNTELLDPFFFHVAKNPAEVLAAFLFCLESQRIYIPLEEEPTPKLKERILEDFKLCQAQHPSAACRFCLAIQSSGSTTEQKKIVFLSQENILFQLQSHCSHPALNLIEGAGSRLTCLPLWHIFGFVLDLLLGVWAQQTIVAVASRSLDRVIQLMNQPDYLLTHAALVPRQIEIVCRRLTETSNANRITLHTGGAPLSPGLRARAQKQFLSLVEGYGLTEGGPGVLINGKPLDGVKIHFAPKGGRLYLHTDTCAYFADRPLDWFDTKDWAHQVDGKCAVIGREGDLIKTSSGKWLHLDTLNNDIAWLLQSFPRHALLASQGEISLIFAFAPPDAEQEELVQTLALIQKKTGYKTRIRVISGCQSEPEFWHQCEQSKSKSVEALLKTTP